MGEKEWLYCHSCRTNQLMTLEDRTFFEIKGYKCPNCGFVNVKELQ